MNEKKAEFRKKYGINKKELLYNENYANEILRKILSKKGGDISPEIRTEMLIERAKILQKIGAISNVTTVSEDDDFAEDDEISLFNDIPEISLNRSCLIKDEMEY